MKRGKHEKERLKIIEVYSVLILIATLFMSVGYAKISDIEAKIEGEVEAVAQEGVFITDIQNVGCDENTDNTKSTIEYFVDTTFKCIVELGNTSSSYITYQVSIFNNAGKDQLFIGVITDKTDTSYYDNTNIEYMLSGLEENVTIIEANKSLDFTITFKYTSGADITNSKLTSILNFRFKDIPILTLSNENQTYTLNDIYPDYTPQEYEFTVSNYNTTKTGTVDMKYYFETTIDGPLTAKIYDSDGNEVTGEKTIEGDGNNNISHTYKLKIIWDNSKTAEYNKTEYAGKEYECNVVLKSSPVDEKYVNYELTKQFNVNIKTASFAFNYSPTSANAVIKNNSASLTVTLNNYISDTVYNKFDTTYTLSLKDNDKFSFTVDEDSPVNGEVTRTLSGASKQEVSLDVKFTADMSSLNTTENLTLKIVVKSPYIHEIEIPVTISLHTVKVTLNPNGGSVSTTSITVYQYKTYENLPTPTWSGHKFDGWYTAETDGTKIDTTSTVTTDSSTQTLYAHWTSYILADLVTMGDYVNYPVSYTNVGTNSSNTYIPKDTYTGWRVLSVEGGGDDKYVRLVSAGVPLSYRHAALYTTSGGSSVTKLTENFFSIPISTGSYNYEFHSSGFSASNISGVKSLFNNSYTQTSSDGTPIVKSITKEDVEDALNITIANLTNLASYDLFAIPSKDQTGYYASYYMATACNGYYLWASYTEGKVVYTYSVQGIRPVVSLKVGIETTGKVDGVWQLSEIE